MFDTADDSVRGINGCGNGYKGALAVGSAVYAAPLDAGSGKVLALDMGTEIPDLIDVSASGWSGLVLLGTKLYGTPFTADTVLPSPATHCSLTSVTAGGLLE